MTYKYIVNLRVLCVELHGRDRLVGVSRAGGDEGGSGASGTWHVVWPSLAYAAPSPCSVLPAAYTAFIQLTGNRSSFGTVYTQGCSTADKSQMAGLTYMSCVENCGSLPVKLNCPRNSLLVLPWLALISQLPYGTRDTLSKFLAILLTVGSPTLAAYSLALAVISNRWMVKRFGQSAYHNTWLAAQPDPE